VKLVHLVGFITKRQMYNLNQKPSVKHRVPLRGMQLKPG